MSQSSNHQKRYAQIHHKNGKVTYSCKQCDMTFEGGIIAKVHERFFEHTVTFA